MTAVCGIISWSCILWTGIRWNHGLKVHGIDCKSFPYIAPLQPYLSYCTCLSLGAPTDHPDGLTVCIFVLIFAGFTAFSESLCSSSDV